jgi:hypothetical protein
LVRIAEMNGAPGTSGSFGGGRGATQRTRPSERKDQNWSASLT